MGYLGYETCDYTELLDSTTPNSPKWSKKEVLTLDSSSPTSKNHPPEVELTPLPPNLWYTFLGRNNTYPVIISSKLDGPQIEKLLQVLKKHREAIGYSISDLKGINPTLCMHQILMEKGTKPQLSLNGG